MKGNNMIRINLGGEHNMVGFINAKFDDDLPECDLIHCYSLHKQGRKLTDSIIIKIKKALMVGGRVRIEAPDFALYIREYGSDITKNEFKNGYDNSLEYLRARIFDDGAKTIFTPNTLRALLSKHGLKVVSMAMSEGKITIEAIKCHA